MKARGRLIAAACAAMLLIAPSASASTRPNPRHVQYRRPTAHGIAFLGEHGGYELAISFEEPDIAVLSAEALDKETQALAITTYGAHSTGSLAGGTVRARFGAIGSIALRFVADGKTRLGRRAKGCQGPHPRNEGGHFVGRVDLRGEGGYFRISTRRAGGFLARTFQVRCRVRHRSQERPAPSLREAVLPRLDFSTTSGGGGSLALLETSYREGGRAIEMFAEHQQGAPPGASVEAGVFEYQGRMPVGRGAFAPESGPGTLVTSLPGEHPATATLAPEAPFSGEATYLASEPTSHSLTGDLVVQFPGLLLPLAGPQVFSSLCVVSPLRTRFGCDFLPPNLEPAG